MHKFLSQPFAIMFYFGYKTIENVEIYIQFQVIQHKNINRKRNVSDKHRCAYLLTCSISRQHRLSGSAVLQDFVTSDADYSGKKCRIIIILIYLCLGSKALLSG